MWTEIIKLTALLLAFTMLLTFVFRAMGKNSLQSKLLQGILFGLIAVIGMSMPVNFAPGLIFDPRSVLVSVAGFFGGPLTAVPAAIIAGGYRQWLGGAGGTAGVLVVALSAMVGVIAYYLRRRYRIPASFINLLLFGLITHFVALFGLLALPAEIVWKVIKNLTVPFLILYPPITVFLGYLINDIEKKFDIEQQLVSSTAQLRTLFDAIPNLLWLKNEHGVYLMCNQHFENFFGASESEIKGKTDYDYMSEEAADLFGGIDKEAMRSGNRTSNEEWATFASDGKKALLETIKTPVYDTKRKIIGVLGISHDITQRSEIEGKLRQSAAVFESTAEGVAITDKDANILDVNQAFIDITGYTRKEVIGANSRILKSDKQSTSFYENMWASINETGQWRGEIWNKRKDQTIYPEWLTISAVKNQRAEVTNYVAVFTDITAIKRSQDKLDFLAHHDVLTSLPNRLLFNMKLEEALDRAQRLGKKLAILFLDVDRFKNINDSFGHKAGDDLLKHLTLGIRQLMKKEDTIARISGDEFILLFQNINNSAAVVAKIEKIMQVFASSFDIEGHSIQVTASIGISLFPMDGDNATDLVRNADAAMYHAKDEGRNNFQFYTKDLTEKAIERVIMENELRKALANNEFQLVYQPQIDVCSMHLIGLEVLLRWQNSKLGSVSPNQFIPLAEDSGLINPIGEWVLNEACRQGKKWADQGMQFGRLAVNVSSVQINKGQLYDTVVAALAQSQLSSSMLELEVTEGAIMKQADHAIIQLKQLRELGLTISVDDFGTGYSSLSYLKKLPINKLKIDQSFIRDIPENSDDKAIVKAIIGMGENLGLTVIAEGVEKEEQATYLKESLCHEVQGYLYSKPISSQEIEKYLRTPELLGMPTL